MESRVRTFRTHGEAERADRAYYRALTPQQRLDLLLELVERGNHGTASRLARVYRIVKLPPR